MCIRDSRWDGSPPDDTYSVDTHPERFAPVHIVAEALIAYLRENYDVAVEEGEAVAGDLLHPVYHDVVRAARLRPNDSACASLTAVSYTHLDVYKRQSSKCSRRRRSCRI